MGEIKNIKEISIDKLIPYANNAKKHPQEQIDLIVRSINEYGFLNPCLIDKDYKVIAGHGRIMAAKQMGMDKVPCLFVEGLTEAQYKAYVLADNKLTEMGEWDMDLVNIELETLQDMDFDISLTGFELPDVEVNTDTEEDESIFDDIEKLEKHYGVPYQGNKSRIADIIVNILPEGERLVDLFGGGGGQ